MTEFEVSDRFTGFFVDKDPFEAVRKIQGEVFRDMPGRRTLRFEFEGKRYFLKHHTGVGWKEIFKNWLSFRKPVLGAENEMRAIKVLNEIGVPTMTLAAYGKRGLNPATQESFVITEALEGCLSLEDHAKNWKKQAPPSPSEMKYIVRLLGFYTGKLHQHKFIHRDYYICHYLVRSSGNSLENAKFYLIDLHRVTTNSWFQLRWQIKDLASLWYSFREAGIFNLFSEPDFIEEYARVMRRDQGDRVWGRVRLKAEKLYLKGVKKGLMPSSS